MKIYQNTTKRIAKKKLGRRWEQILYGSTLKPGDLISSCKGYNERIRNIYPEWTSRGLSKGMYVRDFDITTETGSSCSLIHCCSFPLESKDQIIDYWNYYRVEVREWMMGYKRYSKIINGLKEGKEVFDDDGQPLEEFCPEHERVIRFGR